MYVPKIDTTLAYRMRCGGGTSIKFNTCAAGHLRVESNGCVGIRMVFSTHYMCYPPYTPLLYTYNFQPAMLVAQYLSRMVLR